MLANLLITLSAAVAILALLDLFLSERQKALLTKWVTSAWSYLDDLRSLSLIDWLRNPNAHVWLGITFVLLFVSVAIWSTVVWYLRSNTATVFMVLAIAILILDWVFEILVFLIPAIFATILSFLVHRHFALKLLATVLVAAIPFYLFFVFYHFAETQSNLLYSFFILLFLASGLLYLCGSVVLISIALTYVATAVLYVSEFVVRRIAEYPKGPILACSALFASLSAFMKAFL
jgi:hypothetical protein